MSIAAPFSIAKVFSATRTPSGPGSVAFGTAWQDCSQNGSTPIGRDRRDTRCIATSNSRNRQPLASQSDFNRIPKESFASFGITVPVNRNFSSGCSRKPYEVVPHPSSSTVVSPYSLYSPITGRYFQSTFSLKQFTYSSGSFTSSCPSDVATTSCGIQNVPPQYHSPRSLFSARSCSQAK